jgi:hypothetical protein
MKPDSDLLNAPPSHVPAYRFVLSTARDTTPESGRLELMLVQNLPLSDDMKTPRSVPAKSSVLLTARDLMDLNVIPESARVQSGPWPRSSLWRVVYNCPYLGDP